ncbi:MAG: sulfur carrier protein ThiS [Alphaproteobacteria bacterium]|nr:sulfur carrier protein ThiS [Alphaproteobacteria bacterium]
MLNLIVNGEKRETAAQTIPELLQNEKLPQAHWQAIAVACNGKVVTRSAWAETRLNNGDAIEIVKPFVGG